MTFGLFVISICTKYWNETWNSFSYDFCCTHYSVALSFDMTKLFSVWRIEFQMMIKNPKHCFSFFCSYTQFVYYAAVITILSFLICEADFMFVEISGFSDSNRINLPCKRPKKTYENFLQMDNFWQFFSLLNLKPSISWNFRCFAYIHHHNASLVPFIFTVCVCMCLFTECSITHEFANKVLSSIDWVYTIQAYAWLEPSNFSKHANPLQR